MYRCLLVPLDGSIRSERALPYARALAQASRARLVLVSVTPHPAAANTAGAGRRDSESNHEAVQQAVTSLQRAALLVTGYGPVETIVEDGGGPGGVSAAILRQAQRRQADLLVMATHGRGGLGRWLYGSVADAVLRDASVPVFLIPAGVPAGVSAPGAAGEPAWPPEGPRRVLVPLDGSHLALEALGPAGDLAAALGASVLLLHVVEPPNATLYHHGTRAQLFHPETALAGARRYLHGIAHGVASTQLAAGTDISIRAAIGPPATTVAGVASEEGCDAIAMATHGRGGFARVVLGSVATEVLRRASRPLLLVRPAALRA